MDLKYLDLLINVDRCSLKQVFWTQTTTDPSSNQYSWCLVSLGPIAGEGLTGGGVDTAVVEVRERLATGGSSSCSSASSRVGRRLRG